MFARLCVCLVNHCGPCGDDVQVCFVSKTTSGGSLKEMLSYLYCTRSQLLVQVYLHLNFSYTVSTPDNFSSISLMRKNLDFLHALLGSGFCLWDSYGREERRKTK